MKTNLSMVAGMSQLLHLCINLSNLKHLKSHDMLYCAHIVYHGTACFLFIYSRIQFLP